MVHEVGGGDRGCGINVLGRAALGGGRPRTRARGPTLRTRSSAPPLTRSPTSRTRPRPTSSTEPEQSPCSTPATPSPEPALSAQLRQIPLRHFKLTVGLREPPPLRPVRSVSEFAGS